MLDIKLIRKNSDTIQKKVQAKEPAADIYPLLTLDENVRALKQEIEELQNARNSDSKKVGELKRNKEPADELMAQVRAIGEKISSLNHELSTVEEAFHEALARIPNLPLDEIKISQDKEENEVTKVVGEKRVFDFTPKHHLELNEKLNLFEFHQTAKTSGAGWPAYRGLGARLEWALLSYMIDIQVLRGFEFWIPPALVRPDMMFGSGQMPKFAGQFYEVHDGQNPLYLIPTAEVVLNGLHYDEIIPEEHLPLKYAAYTPCFRREAGAAGAEERGLIRVHQFNKVEMFAFTHPEKSEEMFEEMLSTAEEILQGLGLHYRLTTLVTGDMSFTAAKTVDVEVWLPGQNRYYEVSSISHCTDYQARRSQIRFKGKQGKAEFVHTLNGSGLATPRLMVALLENNQDKDGAVTLPPILAEKLGIHTLKTCT
ncbi:MAG: Serine--tRNA ligase [Chlamydiales bacterium]|nr:Serine--tRNA ligase [Chlamydiales bacterium]MCH9619414.1 Serine--tRNA ligase [Chlamydiales bacterium]MCH9622218.1 Serine--tRNA ligase [Chlamydiales bacterium]